MASMISLLRVHALRVGVALMVPAVAVGYLSCGAGADSELDVELHKRLAGELRDSRLYSAAIEEYQKILGATTADHRQQANINYLIGKVYFEDIGDYEQAAAYYVRARALDPEGSFAGEASKNLVACLERLGRVVDAKRQLDAATDVDCEPQPGDVAVARIDGQPVWLSEVDRQIQQLPPEMQKQLLNRQAKIEFVRQYVAAELMYRAAKREGYESDPEIQRRKAMLYRQLLVDKYITSKLMSQIKLDTLDLQNYYLAHRDSLYHGAPYDSVRAQVFLDYQGLKAEAAFSEYIARLAEAEKAEFLDHNVK